MSFSGKAAVDNNLGEPTASGNGVNKGIEPGQHILRIRDVQLKRPGNNPEDYELTFSLETAPIGGDFVGFKLDNNDANSPTYEGQSGYVNAGNWAFRTFAPNGAKAGVKADEAAFKWISELNTQLGIDTTFAATKAGQVNYNTLEEYFAAWKAFLMNGAENRWFAATLGGRQYESNGYDRYALFFLKPTKTQRTVIPVADATAPIPGELMPLDRTNKFHIVPKKESASVGGFGGAANTSGFGGAAPAGGFGGAGGGYATGPGGNPAGTVAGMNPQGTASGGNADDLPF